MAKKKYSFEEAVKRRKVLSNVIEVCRSVEDWLEDTYGAHDNHFMVEASDEVTCTVSSLKEKAEEELEGMYRMTLTEPTKSEKR
jgi:hypothetical protein